MARPLRPAPAPPSSSTPASSTSTPRTSSRPHRPSAALVAASAPLTPIASVPTTPFDINKHKSIAATEAKTHGLRSVGVGSERTPCPFPGSWGGREKCGITEEDEADEVLMSVLASIASHQNCALSAEEIASTCFQQGWLRPPSAAIEPTTLINNAIRSFMKRCEKHKRPCLLAKYQLAGSVVESVLQPALHPNAFDSGQRPKGTVWYLCGGNGKTKWKSPFDGIEVPKLPARKPAPPKKALSKEIRVSKADDKKPSCQKGKSKANPPVKIRLVLNGPLASEDDESDVGSLVNLESSSRSQSNSVGPEPIAIGLGLAQPISLPNQSKRVKARRPRDSLDSSSESDTSDSDMDFDIPGPSRLVRQPRSYRKIPPPLPLGGSPRLNTSRLPQHSPFMDIFFPSPIIPSSTFPLPHASPFPSHSLDNTTWTARHDRTRHFETSSSSSDDDMRETTWGLDSDIVIRPIDGDDDRPTWSMDEDEAKVKEATDALRVLFPMSSPEEESDMAARIKLNQLDNRPSSFSDSLLAETSFGQLKATDAGGIPLNAWIANSSPAASPKLRTYRTLAPPDFSPTQHLSKLRGSFDPEEMEVDEKPWLDESGELPVKAEDTFSDVDLGSTIGDAPTPEHDRHLHTALWAQEAAAIQIKQEPEDYPSPAPTEDDHSAIGYNASRASSTPSSGLSELPPFEIEIDNGRMGIDEVILGPESVSVEELDGWLPAHGKAERTPHRGRAVKNRNHPSRCSGNWGGIGVGSALPPVSPPTRARSTRSNITTTTRRKMALPSPSPIIDCDSPLTPEPESGDEVDDAIGTDDLEKARLEAEAKEEQHRKACKEKEEQKRALLAAYRQTVRADNIGQSERIFSPWSEGHGQPSWGSAPTDSLPVVTPNALSPMALHNASTPIDRTHQMMAIDPKALVSPPLQAGFNWGLAAATPEPPQDMGMGVLDSEINQQQLGSTPAATVSASLPAPTAQRPQTRSPLPPPPHILPAGLAPPVRHTSNSAPVTPTGQASRPISPASAPAGIPLIAPKATPKPVFVAPAPIQPIPIPTITATAPHNKSTSVVSSPAIVSTSNTAQTSSPSPTTTTPPNEPAVPKITPSPTLTTSSSSTSASVPGKATNSNRAKVVPILALCPGVDACVIDHIPVYVQSFEVKGSQSKQMLLRRLDSDFINGTALLQALGVPENRREIDFMNKPTSAARAAVRHQVKQPSSTGVPYSPGVCGTWISLPEARDFAKRANLQEGTALSTLLRLDLFESFASIARMPSAPERVPSDSFGLSFFPGAPDEPSSASSSSSNLSSANSKSTPNLTALSTSAPATAHPHLRQATAPIHAVVNAHARVTAKGSLVRSAPPTPPDGCPQPKRRRATISSPLAKKTGVNGMTPITGSTAPPAIAPAPIPAPPASSTGPALAPAANAATVGASARASAPIRSNVSTPAVGTRLSSAVPKRATRASIGGGVAPRASVGK